VRLPGTTRLPTTVHTDLPILFPSTTRPPALHLAGNKINGRLPTQLGLLTALNTVDVSNNALTGTLPAFIGSWTALGTLNLAGNSFAGTVPTALSKLTAITSIDLRNNRLTGPIGPALCAIPATQYILFLAGNNFTCVAGCLPPPGDNTLATTPHCLATQDTSICALIATTSVSSQISRYIQTSTVTVENNVHKYLPFTVEVQFNPHHLTPRPSPPTV